MKAGQRAMWIAVSLVLFVISLGILWVWGIPALDSRNYGAIEVTLQPMTGGVPHTSPATAMAAQVTPTDAPTTSDAAATPPLAPTNAPAESGDSAALSPEFAAFVDTVNAQRAQQGLAPLDIHPDMMTLAQQALDTGAMPEGVAPYDNGCYNALQMVGGQTTSALSGELNALASDPLLMRAEITDIGVASIQQGGSTAYRVMLGETYPITAPNATHARNGAPTIDSQANEVLAILNEARAVDGLGPLSLNQTLTDVALAHSQDQSQRDVMTHDGSDGSTAGDRIQRAGYPMATGRENVLVRESIHASCAFDQWWNSPGHYANMMADDVTEIGIAYAESATGRYYYTMVLASPQN